MQKFHEEEISVAVLFDDVLNSFKYLTYSFFSILMQQQNMSLDELSIFIKWRNCFNDIWNYYLLHFTVKIKLALLKQCFR